MIRSGAPTLDPVPPATRPATRPTRADGRRNYDALLRAARDAFAVRGTSASLDEIASAAGVAIGTLYGHFATRDALLEAATRDELAELLALADELPSREEPLAALHAWIVRAVTFCSTYRGFVTTITRGAHDDGSLWHDGCRAMEERGAALLTTAQRADRLSAEVTAVDLFDLIGAAAWLRETTAADHDGSARLVQYFLDGATRR